jgi:ribosomal protein S12 methylthiotransferase accessory factor YcaO
MRLGNPLFYHAGQREFDILVSMPEPSELKNLQGRLSPRVTAVFGSDQELLFVGEDFALLANRGDRVEDVLNKAGLLPTATSPLHRREAAFWEEMDSVPQAVQASLECYGNLPRDAISRALEENRIILSEQAGLRLILTDDYLRPELANLDDSPRPYLLAKPVGREIWVGPFVRPGQTATWTCLSYWLRSHRWLIARLGGWDYPAQPSVASHPASLHFALGRISLCLLQTAARGSCAAENALLTFDAVTGQSGRHPIKARCTLPAPQSFTFEDWVSPHTGIVAELSGPNEQRYGLRHVRARFVLSPLPGNLHRVAPMGHAYGWGSTAEEARQRAIAEAIERYCSTYRGDESLVLGTREDVGDLHPSQLLASWRPPDVSLEPFRDDVPIAWMHTQPLAGGEPLLMPAALVLMDYQDTGQPKFAFTDSVGCAAGPTKESAILSGLLELVERHARARFEREATPRAGLTLGSFGDPSLLEIAEAVHSAGRTCELADISTELPGKVYAAVSFTDQGLDPVMSTAAHLDPGRAVRKALGELAQILVWRELTRDQRPRFRTGDVGYLRPNVVGSVDQDGALLDPADGLASVVSALTSRGLNPNAVDLTRSDVGLPVWRAVIPGLNSK